MATKKSSSRTTKRVNTKPKSSVRAKKSTVKIAGINTLVRSRFAGKNKKTTENEKLKKLNLIAGTLHFAQAVAVVLLSKGVAFPITASYLTTDQLYSKEGAPVLVAASREIFSINMGYLIAAFFAMSAVAHFLVATVYREKYESALAKNTNKVRWFEYAFSASTMMVAISLLAGIYDVSSLFMIFGFVAIMNMMGLIMETHNQKLKNPNWQSFIIGAVAGIIPWIVFLSYIVNTVVYGQTSPPIFVYFILGSIFLLFNCFAVNMYLQYKKSGKWADYIYGEKAYIVLSLVAKTVLAWQVFAGVLRP